MKKITFALIIFLLGISLTGAGCLNIKLEGGGDGGVYKSLDKGENWQQKTFVQQIKKNKSETISAVNVEKMYFDPQDNQTIYLATSENGMYVTYNTGEKWSAIFTDKGKIEDIAIDPKSRNILYVALGNKIFKTTDGGTNWNQVYLETISGRTISCLAIDSYDTSKIYAGISDGRLLRSVDGGKTWKMVKDFGDNIKQVLINKNNTWIVYVATSIKGIFRTSNLGDSWDNITASEKRKDLEEFKGINEFDFAIFDPTKSDTLLIATSYGILKTDDGGKKWQVIKLLSLPQEMEIFSLAINPKNNQEMYYGIANALYKTSDGGKSWAIKSLPTSRAAGSLLIDPQTTEIIYLGAKKVEQKKARF